MSIHLSTASPHFGSVKANINDLKRVYDQGLNDALKVALTEDTGVFIKSFMAPAHAPIVEIFTADDDWGKSDPERVLDKKIITELARKGITAWLA